MQKNSKTSTPASAATCIASLCTPTWYPERSTMILQFPINSSIGVCLSLLPLSSLSKTIPSANLLLPSTHANPPHPLHHHFIHALHPPPLPPLNRLDLARENHEAHAHLRLQQHRARLARPPAKSHPRAGVDRLRTAGIAGRARGGQEAVNHFMDRISRFQSCVLWPGV